MKNIIVLFFTLAFLNGFAQSDYFWVGGTGNWTETTHWATTSGGTDLHVTIPTSSDNIYFDANSFNAAGQTVTVDITGDLCKSMDWSGATNSPTFNVNSKKINIAGSLTLIPEMSWSGNNINLGTTFTSTQASNSIATAGHNLGRLWFDGPGAEWNLTDNVDGYEILITSGVLNTQNFDISLSAGARGIKLQSPSSTHDKGIRLGTSTVTLANGQNVAWDLTGAEVVEASESTIIITGYRNDCCGNYFKGGDHIYNDLIFTSDKSDAGGYWQIEGDNTFNTITYTTDAKLTGSNTINTLNLAQGSTYTFTAGKTQTIGTITGSGDCISGTSWKSSSTSSQTNISIASGTFNLDYFTIQGLNITGGATVNMTNVVDQGNNTGVNIISTTGATNKNLYWVGGSGNWTNGNNWSETSGGTAYGCKPNATDNIYFDANSFNAAGQTVTVDITGDLCKSMDWSGATNSPTFNVNSKKINIAGSLTLIPEMSWSGNNINLGTTFTSTQASNSIATAGHNLGRLWFDGPGAEWNLTDNVDGYEILITSGVLNTQNFDISLSAGARGIKLQSPSSTHDKGIRLGTSTVTLANGQNVAWDLTGAEVVEASESTIIITGYRNDCCGNYFKGGDHIYNDLIFTSDKSDAGGYWQIEGDNTFNTITYTTDAKLTGSNTINTLNLAQGSTYTFTAGKTQTILSDLNANGISNFPVTVKSSNSNPTLIDIPTASVCSDYMAIENVHVINYGYFDAGANSTNQGSNAGILFDGLCTFNPKPMLGTGTETDPFQIANFDHLLWLSDNGGSSQHFLQTADIDASTSSTLNSGLGFSPIAFNASVYNGAGYKISNLFMDRPNSNSDGHTAGVFGLVDNGSVIKNVSIVDADITGYQLVGVIAGELKGDSYLLTSYATGLLESDGRQTGALVGNMRGGSVKNCYSNVYMTRFGSSYPLGTITGNNYGNDLIENCYSIGGGTPITPISYYSGGNAAIKNSFYLDTHTYTGSNWCNNCVESGETSKSETEMKTVSTYIASGWDFTGENTNGTDDVWVEDIDGSVNNGYPYLAMQKGTPAFIETYVDVNPIDDILVNSNTPVVVNISSINNSGGNTVFSATSSNETVSTVSISNSSTTGNETTADLTITNVGEGKSQIYVYGSNPNNRDGGASFFVYEADYTAPSAALTFKVGLDVVSSVSVTEVLLITADFSEPLNDSPVVQIGSNAFSAQNMTKVSDTKYTYEWDAPDNTASGDITFSLSTGTDLSGNVVTSVPTSGTSIFLELASELPLGSGSEEDPYLISSISNLLWLSENGGSSQHFLQTADIDASTSSTLNSGLGFSPIAFNASVYNGAGYKISNLFMDRPNSNSDGHTAGVFGLVDNGSVIKNVSIVDADITGYQLVGVIAGELKGDSYLLTSYATGLLESDGRQTGALVGNMRGGSVKNCYSNVYMTRFGSSYPLGTITGNNYGNDLIENCYSIGGGTPITPISYYSGGNAAIKNSFYLDTHTYTGSNWCNNCVESGETSKSETEMKTVSTYIASGWDFIDENTNGTDDVWMIDENGIINNGFPYFNPDIYTPADTTVPVITLTGDAAVTIEVDATYTDAGASALDNYDGNITNSISVVNTVNTAVVGEYTITYNVSDAAGNNAVQVTRTVNVVDTTVPVITLTGDAAVTIEVDATYTDAGASALDNYDGNITNSISVVNPVNTAVVGEYTITYNVSDAAGNNAVQVTRTVNVVEILGLDSTELNKVSVYPNPTASKWTIESSTIIKTLTLFNLLGQKVLEQTANEMEVNIDVSDLKTGVYLLKINNTTIKRVIKK
ncbi:DUF5011 domain-containing protein [Flavobacteriaceae bacterium]|nr:DUF5011 domain-containing protein [Flavobacteriaceae bacterium]